jgi:type IV pilus assembly protein PilE
MKYRRGFTLVELLVVVGVIALLATIALVSYAAVQRDASDSTRDGNATLIAEALEKYYEKNGEYPSVRGLVNNFVDNTGAAVAAKLGVTEVTLVMPGMSGTNSLSSTAASGTNNYIAYTAYRVSDNTSCQSVATSGCDEFLLQYVEESGDIITIHSRRQVPNAGV